MRETSTPTPPVLTATETPTSTVSTSSTQRPEPTATPEAFDFSSIEPVKKLDRINTQDDLERVFESLPFISEDVLVSPEYDAQLKLWQQEGKCVADFPNRSAVKPIDFQFMGLELNDIPLWMFSIPTQDRYLYQSSNTRPFYNICFAQTEIAGNHIYIG